MGAQSSEIRSLSDVGYAGATHLISTLWAARKRLGLVDAVLAAIALKNAKAGVA